jgi:hypothetical protein
MGLESRCEAQFAGRRAKGTARLETSTLQFRGDELKITLPFASMTRVVAHDGVLSVSGPQGIASFQLGKSAENWANKIRNPPSRLQKIGAKPDWRVSSIGVEDQEFLHELAGVVQYLSIGRVVKNSDAIFFGVTNAAQLARLEALKGSLKPDGAVWVIRPRGRAEVSEAVVMSAGKAAGLVDVKVVSLSSTHTAEKFVIPLDKRR